MMVWLQVYFWDSDAKVPDKGISIPDLPTYLNYYLSGAVCPSVWVSVFMQKKISSKMDQTRKFGEQTSRILEFKPEGLESYVL